jgi:translation elongation factor EF-4
MQPYYEGLQDDDFNKKEVELIETINNILKHESDTKNINRKTKLTDNYSMPTMDSISDYLEKKYGKDSDVIVTIIRTWSKSHKDVSVSVNGWLINSVLDTFKGFVEMIKQRSFGDRMLGRNKGEKD